MREILCFSLRRLGKSAPETPGRKGPAAQDVAKICTTLRRESGSEVKIVEADFLKLDYAKFAPRCGAIAIWKSKVLKHQALGALLEERGSNCLSRGRRRDFDTLQNTWQAQDFARGANRLAGVVDLKRVRNDAFRVAGAGIWWFIISCHGTVTLQRSFRLAITGVRMPRLNFFVAGAILLKHPLKNR